MYPLSGMSAGIGKRTDGTEVPIPLGPVALTRSQERWPSRSRTAAIALVYGALCAVGVFDMVIGLSLVVLFALTVSLRMLKRNYRILLFVAAATVAAHYVPRLALALPFVTLAFVLARALFLIANLRVALVGALAYAIAVIGTVAGRRLALMPLADLAPGAVHPVAHTPLAALSVFLVATAVMWLGLLVARGAKYTLRRALEIMTTVPAIVIGICAPFVTGPVAVEPIVRHASAVLRGPQATQAIEALRAWGRR